MLDDSLIERLVQQKLNALSAKAVHSWRIDSLHKRSLAADLAALAVPALYFPFRYLAKGTSWAGGTEIFWEILAGALVAITIVKLVLRWQERAENHTKLMGQNIAFVAHADYVLNLYVHSSLPDQALSMFLLSAEQDTSDAEALVGLTTAERQMAYREALKELRPDAACRCGASPWQFVPGECQICGGTPKKGEGGKP